MEQASARRLARLRAAAHEAGLDAFYVRDVANIRWLTAFENVFDTENAHALLVTPTGAALHTDSRYSEACRAAAHAQGGVIAVDDARVSHARFAVEALATEAPAPVLGIEDTVSLAEFRRLEEAFAESETAFQETDRFIINLRAVKDADERAALCAAQAVADAAFSHIVEFIRPGVTEREVQRELENFMLSRGGEGLAFSSIVATGANGANPHAVPGDTYLEAGQCVVLDFGARVRGYCADMTRTVFLGEPSAEMRAAYETLRRANEEVQAALRPGATGKAMHELAERVLEEGGFGGKMGHGLGHGVGLEVHEEPCLNLRNERPLEPGNVVTVEPGIYLPGRFGMRLEDFGMVTETGFEAFTQSSHAIVMR